MEKELRNEAYQKYQQVERYNVWQWQEANQQWAYSLATMNFNTLEEARNYVFENSLQYSPYIITKNVIADTNLLISNLGKTIQKDNN